MIYRVGICDEQISVCSELETIIIDTFKILGQKVEVFVWECAETFMVDVPYKVNLDILFLNTYLPEQSGIDVGKYIREELNDEGMHIIYISSETVYPLDLFKTHPYDFLIKPIKSETIYNIIKKLFQLDEQDKRFFIYEYNKVRYKIPMGNILYFMSGRKHINIVCANENREYVGQLKVLADKLPMNFVMIGQSYIINLKHISKCCEDNVVMDNGESLIISRNYKNYFNNRLIEYNKFPFAVKNVTTQ